MTDTQKIQRMAKKDLAVIRNVDSVRHLPTIYLFATKTISAKRSMGILPIYTCTMGDQKTIFVD